MASPSLRPLLRRAPAIPSLARAASSQPPKAKPAPNDEWTLPLIHLGPTHPSRYGQHYNKTLSSDLMYMTYSHRLSQKPEAPPAIERPPTPYEANRPKPPIMRGNRAVRTKTTEVGPETVPKVESIIIHTMVKEAVGNKNTLLSAVAALRAISGETANGGGRKGSSGVQVIAAKKSAAAWKLRSGMPVAVKVELKGEAMYDFLQSLVDFVLPRLRDFSGVPLPPASTPKNSPASLAGVVSFGFGHTAMSFFPQIEANTDAYPRLHGFHVFFKTNLTGDNAHENARALVSGFRIPFHRR
ncbi:50S small subunit ribosomal protein L7 [Cryptococcus wingfieldii CBS 7118]|uniref:50S small subunit ribosomal protein L7 n=1 Tax=Cryptococcus wingfieldii CBS 7118 TaxID=1295528 RepID=A0A1E3J912_9TREE|nr:50S small subunit ribosomal protein L7 [Cryptococcus wingfieldii CBS 7118]ODN97363.1 50S small subunit ribosomal protein L7 [Cryptococcus wingfieldii CBS 7118]